jgi:hypothetical protein
MGRSFLLLFFCLAFPWLSNGQISAPKYSNEFLAIGVGARALGMGSTQVAITNNASSGYWNPAGLLKIDNDYSVSLMHAEYFAGIAQYDFAAFATPIDVNSALGVSVVRFGIDNIPDTRFLYDANGAINYDNIKFFSSADYAFLVSYARKITRVKGLTVGANFKIVHRVAGSFASAWGFGLDASAQYQKRNWQFGAILRDVTGTFNAWSHSSALLYDVYTQTGNEIPQNSIELTLPKLIVGAAYSHTFQNRIGILGTMDLDFSFDGKRNVLIKTSLVSIDPHAGIELDYKQKFFLRSGLGKFQQIKDFDGSQYYTLQPDMGLGLKFRTFQIDYALTDIGNQAESLYSHVFSLEMFWDNKEEE